MHPVAVLFLLACLGTIAMAWRAQSIAAVSLAWSMVSVWAATNLAWLSVSFDMVPLIDLPVAMAAYALWHEDRSPWLAWFSAIYGARLFLHLLYPGPGGVGEAAFFHVYNLTFIAALVAISWKGGADAIGDCLRGLRRLRSLLAANPRAFAAAEVGCVD